MAERGTNDVFIGHSAQLAVMAELLRLGCNAVTPEVDIGTDVLAFVEDREPIVRLQVKACTVPREYRDGSGYSARFVLPIKQLDGIRNKPPISYVLAVLRGDRWVDFLIVSRLRLQALRRRAKFGHHNAANDTLEITVEFRERVTCSGQDLTDCRNAWASLPPLQDVPADAP